MSVLKTVQTNGSYTVDEMLELLKKQQFSCGAPEIIDTLAAGRQIAFPAADIYNQVRITQNNKTEDGHSNQWSICAADEYKNAVPGVILDGVTGGWASFFSFFSGHGKKTRKLVDEIADIITQSGI